MNSHVNFSSIHQRLSSTNLKSAGIALQFFEMKKEYAQFVGKIEGFFSRKRLEVFRFPFDRLRSSDLRPLRLEDSLNGLRLKKVQGVFDNLYSYSVKRARNLFDLRKMAYKVKKKNLRKTLLSMKYYYYSRRIILNNFVRIHKVLVSGSREPLDFFFSSLRVKKIEIPEVESGLDYEIEISATDCEVDSNVCTKNFNVFEQEDSENSKEVSGYLEASPSNSREESVQRQSNFNTFFNQEKEASDPTTNPASVSGRESCEAPEKKGEINRLHSFGKKHFNLTSNTFSEVDLTRSGGLISPGDSAFPVFEHSSAKQRVDACSLPEGEYLQTPKELFKREPQEDFNGNKQILLPREKSNYSNRSLEPEHQEEVPEIHLKQNAGLQKRNSTPRLDVLKVDDYSSELNKSSPQKEDFLDLHMKKNSIFTYGRNNMKLEEYGSIRVDHDDVLDFEYPISSGPELLSSEVMSKNVANPDKNLKKFVSFSTKFSNVNKFMKSEKKMDTDLQTNSKPKPREIHFDSNQITTIKKPRSTSSRVKNFVKNMELSKSPKKIFQVDESLDAPENFFKKQKIELQNSTFSPIVQMPSKPQGKNIHMGDRDSLKINPKAQDDQFLGFDRKFSKSMLKVIELLLKYIEQKNSNSNLKSSSFVFKSKKAFFENLLKMLTLLASYVSTLQKNKPSAKVEKLKSSVDGIHQSLKRIIGSHSKLDETKLKKINLKMVSNILNFLQKVLTNETQENASMPSLRTLLNPKSVRSISSSQVSTPIPIVSKKKLNITSLRSSPLPNINSNSLALTKSLLLKRKRSSKQNNKNRSNISSIEKKSVKIKEKKKTLLRGNYKKNTENKLNNFTIFLNVKLKLKMKKILSKPLRSILRCSKTRTKTISSLATNSTFLSTSTNKIKQRFFRFFSKIYRFKVNLSFQMLKANRLVSKQGFARGHLQVQNYRFSNQIPSHIK